MSGKISLSLERWFLSRISAPQEGTSAADPLESLTVIVPSYCRQPFLLRQIIYWLHSSAKVIILDGSPEPLNSNLQQAFAHLPNINYISNPVNFVERLSKLRNSIVTPYVVMLGDDEFHLQKGLRQALRKLQGSSDLAGCIGQSVRFFVEASEERIAYGIGYQHFKFSILDEDIAERFTRAMKNYNAATCYAVLRTDAWSDSWASMLKTSCKDVCEVQQALATYAAGKFATVDQVYWLRSNENISISDRNYFLEIGFSTWWSSGRYTDERKALMAALVTVIQKYARLPTAEAVSAARRGLETFNEFYQRSYPPPSLFNRARMKGVLVSILKSVLPTGFYSALKYRVMPGAGELDPVQLADIGYREDLAANRCKNLFTFEEETDKELQVVESLILDFYRNI